MSEAIRMKFSLVLEQNKPNYTKSEKKIYDYVQKNLEKVMYHSLTELSDICATGEATILRFCRKIGFNGYQDFKLAVAQEFSIQNSKMQNNETYIEKIKSYMQQVLEDTYSLVNLNQLEMAISILNDKSDVIVFGVGHSGITALDLKSRFLRIGKKIEVITDPHFQIMRSCTVDTDTVIIAISLTGSTIDIVDAVNKARSKGAKIIAITNYVKSPLTKYADIVLLTAGKENPLDGGSMAAKVSQLYVIDMICTGFSLKNIEQSQNFKKDTAEAVSVKLY